LSIILEKTGQGGFQGLLKGYSEGEFLVIKFEFRGSDGIRLEGDYSELEITPNLELIVTFGMSLSRA
jgi:hypothetical protein